MSTLSLVTRSETGEAKPAGSIDLPAEFSARYELGRLLGSGAMGMVCRALDRTTRRAVAVKFLLALEPVELLQRFVQEGRLMAKIRHPNVAPIYDLEARALAAQLGSDPFQAFYGELDSLER